MSFGPPSVAVLDLPQVFEGREAHQPLLAAWASPWPGTMAIWRSPMADGFTAFATFSHRGQFGTLIEDLAPGTPAIWYRGALEIEFASGNLFRILQEHYVAFLDLMRFQITTQAGFERLLAVDPETLTDLQRAARFLFLQRTAFGGKISGRNFGISTDRPARFNLTTLEPDLEARHERLSGVTVTCLDFAAFIDRIDRPSTLFYLDPPYYGCEDDYGRALFSRDRFVDLAEQLGRLKGRFILSLNDLPEVREIFGRFQIEAVMTSYSIAAKGALPDRGEVLISGGSGV